MPWIGRIYCKEFYCNFVAWTFALIAIVRHDLNRVSYINETVPNALKHYETKQNMILGSKWGWISCIRCKKFGNDFVAWTFALIAPVQLISHRVSCSNEMVPNAPKHYETQQKLSLGSNGVDPVHSLQKLLTQVRGTIFELIGQFQPILHWVYCLNKTIPNAPKH